jgi:protoporphyrinogen oxidase
MPFLKIFNLETNYDLRVMTANQTPNQVCSKVLSALDAILEEEKPDAILMQGDTTTAFTGAFAAFNRKIVYPKNGISTLCEKLAEGLADKIKLETPVEEILVENEKVFAVKAKGETQKVSAVVSTAPANILVKLVKGTNKLENFKAFRYRPMIFVNMRFEGRGLLPDTVLWFPEREFPFFRLTEATISIP